MKHEAKPAPPKAANFHATSGNVAKIAWQQHGPPPGANDPDVVAGDQSRAQVFADLDRYQAAIDDLRAAGCRCVLHFRDGMAEPVFTSERIACGRHPTT